MQADFGLIGGTGVGERLAALGGSPLHVPTPFGLMRGRQLELGGRKVVVVARHSLGHKTPPHLVNYRANAVGLALLGVGVCIGTAAVGALREDLAPGSFVLCSDFIDLTGRGLTLFDREVRHTDFSQPFGERPRQALLMACDMSGVPVHASGVYVGTNGPRYETPAEVAAAARLGGDVIGMTATSEAICMREAGVEYACLAIVTNLATGLARGALSHEEVEAQMKSAGELATKVLCNAVALL
ncbi:MAG: MTAP family purine nucleoside phosphorylase [Fimbriimonas ginsengisoli]|uniref:MTAP family purine nucleoside phosphorylase n=1 Tax=Fimbriimonas ginsengisoli TaxID=1005039 RepID=A0A931PSZ9_FIMGI|nr:MTAP family purine nucleoside phosphorylase [Fimbriimonas ginsengisoli]